MKDETYGYFTQDITLAVGEKTKIKSGFLNTMTLVYWGMISKDIFSISILYGTGNQGFSYNLYYQKDIILPDQKMSEMDWILFLDHSFIYAFYCFLLFSSLNFLHTPVL